jgi:4-amino-4-deoxy-L-arabinose transferase-like glycosyltransferase
MPPVRVKVYGLLNLTRRTYLTLQVLGFVVGLGAIGVGLWCPRPKIPVGVEPPLGLVLVLALLDSLPWLAPIVLLLEAGETFLVLRRFAQKQAQQDLEIRSQESAVSNQEPEVRKEEPPPA